MGYPNGGRDILKRFDHLKLLDKIGSVLKNGILKLNYETIRIKTKSIRQGGNRRSN